MLIPHTSKLSIGQYYLTIIRNYSGSKSYCPKTCIICLHAIAIKMISKYSMHRVGVMQCMCIVVNGWSLMAWVLKLVEGEGVIFICYSPSFMCHVRARVVQDNPLRLPWIDRWSHDWWVLSFWFRHLLFTWCNESWCPRLIQSQCRFTEEKYMFLTNLLNFMS